MEIEELRLAMLNKDKLNINDEFEDILFTLINRSYCLGINHEDSLRSTNQKFLKRFMIVEVYVGDKIGKQSVEDFNKSWKIAKEQLKDP